ncbi:extracellular solute-binding protein [bacterium]|nr:extracellular solute-binding protein [bacterium]
MIQRRISLSLLMILAAWLLVACAPTPGAAPTTGNEATGGEPSGNLLIWVQQANQDVFEQTVLDEFQAAYPDITLSFVNYPPAEVADQVVLAIQGGTGGPDIAVTENASIGRLVNLGGLLDLSEELAPYKDSLNDFALAEGSADGKNYCVPWDIGPVVTFYRSDIFEAAGLSSTPAEVSELVATWDSFLDACVTIKEETGASCFAMNKANNYGDMYFNMLWQQGLGFYNDQNQVTVDGPQYVETLQKLGQFWEADVVSDELEWTDNWYAELNAPLDDPNVTPMATVTIGSWMGSFLKTWVAADRAGDWGVIQMPAYTQGGVRAANQGGSCIFIPAATSNREAAWAFIEFMLLNDENQKEIFAYSDYFPALESVYDDPMFDEGDPYFADQPVRQIYAESAVNMPSANLYGPYAQAVRGAVATAIQQYALGQLSAEEALKQAADNIRVETELE